MIELINSISVLDENHNVIKFKYNDGLVIHDCVGNTLIVSYLIIKDLMTEDKTFDQVLYELNEFYTMFNSVKCYDRELFIDLVINLKHTHKFSFSGLNIVFSLENNEIVMGYSYFFQIICVSRKYFYDFFKNGLDYKEQQITKLIINLSMPILMLDPKGLEIFDDIKDSEYIKQI